MGFGFSFLLIFIVLPITIVFFVAEAFTRKGHFLKSIGLVWLCVLALVFISQLAQWLTATIELEKKDYYGQYIICRDCFPGKQADWQYEHFRFEIRENDSIIFYETNKEKILKTYPGKIRTTDGYISERLVTLMDQPSHHILSSDPTIYRGHNKFYLVFNSRKFGNVFFKKGEWGSLDN